jgi:hypothetical protein
MTDKIMPVAQSIIGDEKAIGLTETNYQSPGNRGFHRYQCIYVVRDGRTAEFRRDLGPTKKWKGVKLLNIPSLLEHTCDELIALAEELRNEQAIDVKDLLELDKINLV